MHRKLIFLALLLASAGAHAIATCPITVGGVNLSATSPRTTAASPFTVFFDATATTSSVALKGANTVIQDVFFVWNFSDSAASGKGTWGNGAQTAFTAKNTGTGIVQGHTYILADGAGDKTYTPIVTAIAFNADNTLTAVTCSLAPITVQDPAGVWPAAATTCQANGALPVAGSNGCPAGAAVLNSGTVTLGNLSNKRILYRCGDTFTNTSLTISGTKGSVDRYGACTGSNNPIFLAGGTGLDGWLTMTNPSTDMRVSNIVFNGNGITCSSIPCDLIGSHNGGTINGGNKPFQYTFYNLDLKNYASGIRWDAAGQMAFVASTVEQVQFGTAGCPGGVGCEINAFPNTAGIGSWTTSGPSEDYGFWAGNHMDNGVSTGTFETFRANYLSKWVITNNTHINAGSNWAVLKIEAQDFASDGHTFDGTFTQNVVITDNFFGGSSGANLTELSPQNTVSDERLRLIDVERNMFNSSNNNGRQIFASGANMKFADNIFVLTPPAGGNANVGVQVAQRGIEPGSQGMESYNNTCYSTSLGAGTSTCIGYFQNGQTGTVQVANSFASNNLAFNQNTTVGNVGGNSGTNTVSNNTVTPSSNPGFKNYSGSFSQVPDFKPTANFTGALNNVPVLYDALGVAWSATWDLGAVHH